MPRPKLELKGGRELACGISPLRRYRGELALGQKEGEMGGTRDSGLGPHGDRHSSRELISGMETHKQQPGKAGLPENLMPESRGGSPHHQGWEQSGGGASSEGDSHRWSDVLQKPAQPYQEGGDIDECGRKGCRWVCGNTSLI